MNHHDKDLDQVFFALADTTRRGILSQLINGKSTIGKISQPYSMSAPAISKHLRILERANLIKRSKIGRQHHCELTTAGLKTAEDWLQFHREFWKTRLDALDALLGKSDPKGR